MFALRSGLLAAFLICMFFLAGCGDEPASRESHSLTLSSDVIIYGNSIAALSAALEAAEQGAAVMVFYEFQGGDQWLWEEGLLVPSPPQPAEAPMIEGEGTGAEEYENGSELAGVPNAKLLSPETESALSWFIEKNGLVIERKGPQLFTVQSHSYEQLYRQMIQTASRYGVRFFGSCRPVEILFNDDRVAGLLIETGDGLRKAFAPSVILADGGYLGNKELMETWAPGVDIASWREHQAGFGMQLAVTLDLELADLDCFAYYPAVRIGANLKRESLPSQALLITGEQAVFIDGLTRHAIVEELNKGPANLLVAEAQMEDDRQLEWPRFSGLDHFLQAYNLDMPHLKRFYANPSGYFRGVELKAVAEYCLGGVRVNEARLALYRNKPVSGLYIAGELACSLQGRNVVPGAALTEEVVTGRIAGRNAASYSQR